MPRALVVIPTSSYRTADFVAAAQTLGIELAVASDDDPPLGMEDRFVRIDCDDVEGSAEAMADLAAHTPIDAIIAADDLGVAMAAGAARKIGLPHNPIAAVHATLDKASLRAALAGSEVRQPEFAILDADDDPRQVVAGFGAPVVIKPTSLSASRGVIRVDEPDRAADVAARVRAIQESHGHAASRPLLVERFIPGPEVAVEAMVWDGDVEVLAVFDKPEPLDGPYFEETIYVTPSRLPELDETVGLVRRATGALGLTHGPIHAEVRVEDGIPHLIEIAARSIGGLCGRALRFGLMGSSLETLILRQALGLRPAGRRERRAAGVLMVPTPSAGRLAGFDGVDATLAIEGVDGFEPAIPIGEQLVPPPEGGRYLGFVFATADDPESVERALRAAKATLTPHISGT